MYSTNELVTLPRKHKNSQQTQLLFVLLVHNGGRGYAYRFRKRGKEDH